LAARSRRGRGQHEVVAEKPQTPSLSNVAPVGLAQNCGPAGDAGTSSWGRFPDGMRRLSLRITVETGQWRAGKSGASRWIFAAQVRGRHLYRWRAVDAEDEVFSRAGLT